jgi:hypothetical protein
LLGALWRRMTPSPWRWSLLALIPIVVVLPFVDELWIAWNFERHCKEAGVTVVRKVEVDGFVNTTNTSVRFGGSTSIPTLVFSDAKALAEWDNVGYRFKEQMLTDGGVWHIERYPDGVYGSTLDKPTGRYHYRYADPRQWVPVGYQINRMERQVFDSVTGEVIGRQITLERYPGFIEGVWIRLLGSGQIMCPDPGGPMQPAFPESILIPSKTH